MTTQVTFPELSVRIDVPRAPNDSLLFDLHTANVDADDDGRARDFGVPVIEGGIVVGDGTRDGYDLPTIKRLFSLLEHAPELHGLLRAFVDGPVTPLQLQTAKQVLNDIAQGSLRYEGR